MEQGLDWDRGKVENTTDAGSWATLPVEFRSDGPGNIRTNRLLQDNENLRLSERVLWDCAQDIVFEAAWSWR
jgi:hypothetical protein